jgi:hypothetical protein
VTGRRGRRRRKLLDDLKERRGYSHLEEEAVDSTKWRACFGRGCNRTDMIELFEEGKIQKLLRLPRIREFI